MRHLSRFFLATLFTSLLIISIQAEPLVVTGGSTGPFSIASGGLFTFTGDNFVISGGQGQGFGSPPPACSPCAAGETFNLRTFNSGGDLFGGPATINGTSYERLSYGGFLRFDTTFVVSSGTSGNFTIVTPFVFSGSLLGCSVSIGGGNCSPQNVVFNSELTGQGFTTVQLSTLTLETGVRYFAERVRYDFGSTQPIPEPASVLLLMSGLVGVGALARKRRKAN